MPRLRECLAQLIGLVQMYDAIFKQTGQDTVGDGIAHFAFNGITNDWQAALD